ncbi:MAG: PQQ-binding-like beta-propeller repeat protein [Pseudomonadota bacterium]
MTQRPSTTFTHVFGKGVLRAGALTLAGLALAGCSILSFGRSSDADLKGEAPPEEERISVLSLGESLDPDPRFLTTSISLPPSYKNPAWTQAGGAADHSAHHLEAELALKTDWVSDVGAPTTKKVRITAPPIVSDGKIYTLDASATVQASDASSGKRLWRTQLTTDMRKKRRRFALRSPNAQALGFGGGVAYEDGRVFVSTGFGYVAALDAETGEETWRTETGAPVRTAPAVANGRVFATNTNNRLVALDAATGASLWDFQAFEEAARILSSASPAVDDDLVIAPFSSGEVVALRAQNGRVVWAETLSRASRLTALSTLSDIAGAPVIDRGLVYAVSHSGRTAAIDIRSGRRVWEKNVGGIHMPWAAGDYLFMVTVEGDLVCLARQDGAVAWVTELPKYKNEKRRKGKITWAGPVLASDMLYLISTEGRVIGVDAVSGEVKASERLVKGGSVLPPIVVDGKLYVLSDKGKLVAVR